MADQPTFEEAGRGGSARTGACERPSAAIPSRCCGTDAGEGDEPRASCDMVLPSTQGVDWGNLYRTRRSEPYVLIVGANAGRNQRHRPGAPATGEWLVVLASRLLPPRLESPQETHSG